MAEPGGGSPVRWRSLPTLGRAVVVGGAYALLYLLTARLQPPQFVGSTPFWLPNAGVFALLLWSRRRDWVVYLPFAVAADALTARYLWGTYGWVEAVVAALNFGEAALGAFAVQRLVGVPRLVRVREVLVLLGVAGLAVTALSATAVTIVVDLWTARSAGWTFWRTFWTGDAIGMFVLAPALLVWGAPPTRRDPKPRAWLEPLLVATSVVLVIVAVFLVPWTRAPGASPYLLVPPVLYAAVRLGRRAASAGVLAIALTTTWLTSSGRGPFVTPGVSTHEHLTELHLFFASTAVAALLLAALQETSQEHQRDLERSEARFRTGFLASPIGLVFSDVEGRYRQVNPAFCDLVGRDEAQLIGMSIGEITHPQDVADDLSALDRLVSGEDRTHRVEKRYVRPDGTVVWANVTVAALCDDGGRVTSLFAQVVDVTARREAEVVLARQATHDPLTGLPNRRLFLELLRAALRRAERDTRTIAVLFVDVDRFKQVNDLHGHAAGDELLVRIGQALAQIVRPSDVTARHGGDEFTVLLDDLADEAEAAGVAERVLGLLSGMTFDHASLEVSIGVAATSDSRMPPETLVAHADAAMYRAKSRGGGRWQLFDEVTYQTLLRRARQAEDLQDALPAGELLLHYQPIVRLNDGAVVAVEALLRWEHARRGLLAASDFVDVLEHSSALDRISRWVVQQACADLSRWRRDTTVAAPGLMHINVAPRQLVADDLVDVLESSALAVGLDPSDICVEVTESAVADLEQAETMLSRLREIGCSIALDDFGIGHSSLSRLAGWPVDEIKVDKSLVQQVTTPRGVALVTAAMRLSDTLGCGLIAEGVETAAQRDAVQALGVNLVQGFLLGPPVTATQLVETLRHHAADGG